MERRSRGGGGMRENWSYGELADFNHEKQVEEFNWCSCEEQEYFPYEDCPKKERNK